MIPDHPNGLSTQPATEESAVEKGDPKRAAIVGGGQIVQDGLTDALAGGSLDDRQIQPVMVLNAGAVPPLQLLDAKRLWVPVSRFTSGSSVADRTAGASAAPTGRRTTRSPVMVGFSAKEISANTAAIMPGTHCPT